MNTLDLYIDHLKLKLKEAEHAGFSNRDIEVLRDELERAVEFAQSQELTVRHLSAEQHRARHRRAAEIAEELWLQQNSDDQSWAKMAWADMTAPDDWSGEALKVLEEAYTIMDKEKTDD